MQTYFIIMGYLTWYGNKVEGDCFLTALDKDLAGIVSPNDSRMTLNQGWLIEG